MDPNRLAALIDSQLSEHEREQLIAGIGPVEAAGVLSDAIAALADVEATAPPRSAQRAQRKASRRWHPGAWMALAACVAGLLLIPFAWSRAHRATRGGPERYAALVVAHGTRIPGDWNDTPWDVARGSAELTPEARAFRIGVRVTDLGVAVRQGDSTASRYAAEIAALVDQTPGAGPVSAAYRAIAASSGPARVARADAAARTTVALPDAELIRLGAWVEAARLATANGDVEFFTTPESQSLLRESLRSHVSGEVRRVLASIARATQGVAGGAPIRSRAKLDTLAMLLGAAND